MTTGSLRIPPSSTCDDQAARLTGSCQSSKRHPSELVSWVWVWFGGGMWTDCVNLNLDR